MTTPSLDPLVAPTINLGYKLLSALLQSQVSVFAFGAENSGKTSFIRRQEGFSSLDDIFGAGTSNGLDPQLVRVFPLPADQDTFIRLLYLDMGGQKGLELIRKDELKTTLPLGILLFLDHRDTNQVGIDNEQVDDGTFDPTRLKRHHEVFKELTNTLHEHPKIREACNTLIVILNKYDLWRSAKTTVDHFQKEFQTDIEQLMTVGNIHRIPSFMPCSIKTGEGIPDILRTLFRLSGWEIMLPFGKRIKIKSNLLR